MTRRLRFYLIWTLCVCCTAFFIFGCGKSQQTSYGYPVAISAHKLVPEATGVIRDGLADDSPQVRAKAIEVVAGTKRIKLMPKVRRLLKDDFVPVRFLGALAVGDLEYRLASSEIGLLLGDEDENVKISAAYAMAKLGSPDSLEVVRKAIVSNDQKVRANAALLLGKSGDRSALKFLYWALRHEDSDDKVRFNAAEAIARLGDERIFPKLLAMLQSGYNDDRVVSIRAMGALGTARAKDSIITKLDDDVLEVRLAAAEQLGMLGDSMGEAVVLDVFGENQLGGLNKKGIERVKVLTALAIGQICTEPVRRFLPGLLQDESKFVRLAAAKAVFECTMRD
ncbi:MAG: HEAT repeat domain-containing protein [Planctomycetota bacterium]|nr:MAG: HEAT repeat domain-containing protein [Planctomycetota bacterium]